MAPQLLGRKRRGSGSGSTAGVVIPAPSPNPHVFGSHGVVPAAPGRRIADVDLRSPQPLPAAILPVLHHHGCHGMAPAQVHTPPRLPLSPRVATGAVLPDSVPVPVHRVDGNADVGEDGGLAGRAPQCCVISCRGGGQPINGASRRGFVPLGATSWMLPLVRRAKGWDSPAGGRRQPWVGASCARTSPSSSRAQGRAVAWGAAEEGGTRRVGDHPEPRGEGPTMGRGS